MTQEHPITPPPELVEKWLESTRSNDCIGAYPQNYEHLVATQAARWGADKELEACCEWLDEVGPLTIPLWGNDLRKDRRPKPPSFKKQALKALDSFEGFTGSLEEVDIIRRALESLPD